MCIHISNIKWTVSHLPSLSVPYPWRMRQCIQDGQSHVRPSRLHQDGCVLECEVVKAMWLRTKVFIFLAGFLRVVRGSKVYVIPSWEQDHEDNSRHVSLYTKEVGLKNGVDTSMAFENWHILEIHFEWSVACVSIKYDWLFTKWTARMTSLLVNIPINHCFIKSMTHLTSYDTPWI